MNVLFVVNNPRDWPLHIAGVEVVPARAYLTEHTGMDLSHSICPECYQTHVQAEIDQLRREEK